MVLAWVVLFVALLLFELHHLAFYALFGALGAFAAGVVALFFPGAIGLQALVAVSVSIGGVIVVRPFVSTAFHNRHRGHVARGVHGGLIGQEAVTLDEIGDLHQIGHVRLAGERWLAITGGDPLVAGTPVVVTAIRGTTLEVWPADLNGGDGHSSGPTAPRSIEAPDGADGRSI